MTDPIEEGGVPGAAIATARDWVVRLASKDLTPKELQRFKAWLDEAPAHRDAFETERRFWHRLEGLKAASGPQTWAEDAPDEAAARARLRPRAAHHPTARRRRRSLAVGGALAAGLALFMVADDITVALLADYQTAEGAQQKVVLPDGSTAFLNTDSAIRIVYDAGERRIDLLQGEAFFEVVADRARPFRVAAAGGVTQAVGTAFVVRATDTETRVAVTHGRVEVRSPNAAEDPAATVRLHRGQATRYAEDGRPQAARTARAAELAPWRSGTIRIDDLPLDQALAELDRYRVGHVVLLADSTRLRSVSGAFDIDGIDAAIAGLAAIHGLKVTVLTDYLVILR
jgi:transmembrane sensor